MGRGRPRSPRPREVQVRIRLTRAEAEALDAKRRGLSRSAYIRLAIEKAEGAVAMTTPRTPRVPVPPQAVSPVPAPVNPVEGHVHKMADTGQTRQTRGMVSRERACTDAACDEVRWT